VRHFFYEGNFKAGDRIHLSKEESSHALNSVRLGKGESVIVSNGEGLLAQGKIWKNGSEAEIEVLETRAYASSPALEIWQATLKGPKMDWLVEKLTELGVRSLQLVQTERTVAQTEKMERWEKIATAALKQSENPWRMKLYSPQKLETLQSSPTPNSIKFFLSPDSSAPLIHALGQAISAGPMPDRIILVIGPEGGLSKEEETRLIQAGFQSSSLHPNILRGETAGIVAAALTSHWLYTRIK